MSNNHSTQQQAQSSLSAKSERPFATDIFMLFAYTLLAIATVSQIILIIWLDIV